MALHKIEDFNPRYREEAFDGEDFKGLNVYAGRTDEKIGTIDNVLVDEMGRFRYLVIDTGFWIFGKKVLLPVGRCHVDADAQKVYAVGLATKDQAENLPPYDETINLDYNYEERVRDIYRKPPVGRSSRVEMTPPVEGSGVVGSRAKVPQPESPRIESEVHEYKEKPVTAEREQVRDDRDRYRYDLEPELYQMSEIDHQKFKLYEERLVASKSRRQAGEVEIGKRVETDTARASVPVEKERVIIERNAPKKGKIPAKPGEADFHSGKVAEMEVYEEKAEIDKQAFVREEVDIHKEVDTEQVEATEKLRREELDIDTEGRSVVNRDRRS
ncbi:DUF2382 domain-containing protein [Oscillatoria salina]|uniref:DUF2382 domain-containing protein n=1 Tax=Oscillatoria salina TaxID=331517 RepID=UPI0013BAB3FB|nr:DUF2382 domain-containing protein [Oscillatoria salina]MBZ8179682.1 DUF2382 domain-containing protein [Oscillatoria salina IIICB1]NET87216.1 DUF2382 domain-containing protein [Kamptonema sp. SIO1D9]